MKKVVRLTAILLAAALLFSVTALAAATYTEGYFQYQLNNGSITIVGYFGSEKEVTVPSMIAGYPVNTLAKGSFPKGCGVTAVHLPDTVVTIEAGAADSGIQLILPEEPEKPVEKPSNPSTQQPSGNQPGEGGWQESGDGSSVTPNTPSAKPTAPSTTLKPTAATFADVKPGSYYEKAVVWAVSNNVTSGVGGGNFGPEMGCTRAQVVTFLYRAAGSPAVSGAAGFTDVKRGSYYENAVIWAAQNKITGGITATAFGPDKTCTRAQVVSFLYRFLKAEKGTGKNPFRDVKTSDYFYDAVLWASGNGVTSGITATTFGPENTCTRAQVVTFLYRALAE